MKKLIGALCVAFLLSGCAGVATLDKTATVSPKVMSEAKQFVQMTSRVNEISYHLAVNGAAMCSSTEFRNPLLLYSAKTAGQSFTAEMLAALYQSYGLDNSVRVLDVTDGAPVVDGSLHRGDRVVQINGEAISDDVADATKALQSAVAAGQPFDVVIAQSDGANAQCASRLRRVVLAWWSQWPRCLTPPMLSTTVVTPSHCRLIWSSFSRRTASWRF